MLYNIHIDGSSFLKVTDEQNTLRIQKYGDVYVFGRFGWLPPATVHSAADLTLEEVVDPCFIHCHIFTHKLLFVALKQLQSMCCCFWLTVSKCINHFEHSFLTDKCSSKMVNTLPSDILNSSAISCNFNLWSTKVFWCFLRQLQSLGDLSIQHHLCLYDHV